MKRKILLLLFLPMLYSALAFDKNFVRDFEFNRTLNDTYAAQPYSYSWSSYSSFPTAGFSSSRILENTTGNYFYRVTTSGTSNLSVYQRALNQYSSEEMQPGHYMITFKARNQTSNSEFSLKISAKTALIKLLPKNASYYNSNLVKLEDGLFTFMQTQSTEWVKYQCAFDLTHSKAELMRFNFLFNGSGTIDIDSVVIRPFGDQISKFKINNSESDRIDVAHGTLQMFVESYTPAHPAIDTVSWSVDSTQIAEITETGLLTAKRTGDVIVIAKALDGSDQEARDTIHITNNNWVTYISFANTTKSTLTGVNDFIQYDPVVYPTNALNQNLLYSVDNTNLAKITANGELTPRQNGKVIVKAAALDGSGIKREKEITITGCPTVTTIMVSSTNNSTSINTLNGKLQLNASFSPESATNKEIYWTVNNPEIASISANGELTAKRNGTIVATATAKDGGNAMGSKTITITNNAPTATNYRLANRYSYFCDNTTNCTYKTVANWNNLNYSNGGKIKATTSTGEFVKYKADLKGLSGLVDVLVYRGTLKGSVDNKVKVDISHNNQTESFYADFSTTRDGWFSLGKFHFNGDGTEYVNFTRTSGYISSPTPALPIRFDVYYDMKGTAITAYDTARIGFGREGAWTKSTTKKGYRGDFVMQSSTAGNRAKWNPGTVAAGKVQIYVFRPQVYNNDKYEIIHNSKVDVVYLKNLKSSNLSIKNPSNGKEVNPLITQEWYKIGEFDFSGAEGQEFVRLTKQSGETTYVDCMMFESVKYDGTILHRTVVRPFMQRNYVAPNNTCSLETKENKATVPVGFYPSNDLTNTTSSMYVGSTIYSRALYITKQADTYTWNPLITEPGDYKFYYYCYYATAKNPTFSIKANGATTNVTVPASSFVVDTFTTIGSSKFTFSGNQNTEEYISMTNIDRASDILLEKEIDNGGILRQVAVTVHPYFKEYVYPDTKGTPAEADINYMVKQRYMFPTSETTFAPNNAMSRAEFIQSVCRMLQLKSNTSLKTYYTDLSDGVDTLRGYIQVAYNKGLLYNIPDTTKIYPNNYVTRQVATQILLNAMEYAGRYTNVKNLYKSDINSILANYTDGNTMDNFAKEAFARMLEAEVMKIITGNTLNPKEKVYRKDAAVILKEFLGNVLASGPHSRKTDWELTFNDDFKGDQLNFDKWSCDDYVRFEGVSGKWKENCVVEDGVFKGYNFMDNNKTAYSSGNIFSKYQQTYGFFEARYKYPDKAYGSHSSFWTAVGQKNEMYAGDFNYNEGTYPNHISNNNYFMTDPVTALPEKKNFHNFSIPMNMAKDFHTISGYLNDKDLYYGLDGKKSYSINNYPQFYGDGKTTNMPYGVWMSTIISYFDGAIDRERLDSSYMACDWVRVYKEIVWTPELDMNLCIPTNGSTSQSTTIAPVLKFNKAIKLSSLLTPNNITITCPGGNIPTYKIRQMTPLRYRIEFSSPLSANKTYKISVKNVIDSLGNTMKSGLIQEISFTTGAAPTASYTDTDAKNIGFNSDDQSGAFSLSVYPNPFNGNNLTFKANLDKKSDIAIRLYNGKGNIVFLKNINVQPAGGTSLNLDLPVLPSGIYMMKINIGDKQRLVKLIKQ